MFRKMFLAATIAAATVVGLTAMPASAESPTALGRHDGRDRGHDRHDRGDYRVSVRHFGQWHAFRTYDDRDDAQRAARSLERRGYDTKIERVPPR